MDNIPIDVVRLADSSDEPYNKYKKTNEDRLNANFRRLKEVSEQLGKKVDGIQSSASTGRELYVSNNYVRAHFYAVGNVKTAVFTDLKDIPTGVITTIIQPSEMAEFIPTIPLGYDFVAMSSDSEHVRLFIDTLGVRAYNYSNNTDVINTFQTITYI